MGLDDRLYRVGAAAAAVAVAAASAVFMGPGPAAARSLSSVSAVASELSVLSAATLPGPAKTVTYLGRHFAVPKSWRVVDLAAHPTACVRFDVHAIYLGQPSAQQQCPARGAGRHTGALLIQPNLTRSTGGATVALDRRVAAEIDVSAPGIAVTASYGDDRATVVGALATAGLPQPAPNTVTVPNTGAVPGTVTVPNTGAVPNSAALPGALAPAPNHDSAPVEIVRGTNLVTGLGFDTCTAPSAAQMQAWGASPFNTVGVYIGGSERACAQANLTRSWVTARAASGWHFMPLYVGWQAAWDSLTATAPASLGKQSADDAVVQARALGFGAGALLYYDMESYKTTAQSAAALAFLSAWTIELHAQGYRSAVYSSASTGIADLVAHRGKMTEPDVVDIAQWNGVADADLKATPASTWTQQRVHQYLGNVTVAYGGTTMNIDDDYLSINNPPCGVTPPSPTPTSSPSVSLSGTPSTSPSTSRSGSPSPVPSGLPGATPSVSLSATPSTAPRNLPDASPGPSLMRLPGLASGGGLVPTPGPSAPASNRLGTC